MKRFSDKLVLYVVNQFSGINNVLLKCAFGTSLKSIKLLAYGSADFEWWLFHERSYLLSLILSTGPRIFKCWRVIQMLHCHLFCAFYHNLCRTCFTLRMIQVLSTYSSILRGLGVAVTFVAIATRSSHGCHATHRVSWGNLRAVSRVLGLWEWVQ